MTKLAMFAAATLLAAAPAVASDDEGAAGYLGVRLQRVEGGLAEALDRAPDSGVLVSQVLEGTAAEKAGLEKGDIVTKVDGAAVGTPDDLRRAIRARRAGDVVKLTYVRDGKTRTAEATLSATPLRAGAAQMDRVRRHLRDVRDMRLGRERGWLGVTTQPLTGELGEYFGAKQGGALVASVEKDSPAAKLGLKPGDVIVKVDGEEIEDPADLRRAVGRHGEPAEVEVTWLRDRRERRGKTTLAVREGLAFRGEGGPGLGLGPGWWDDEGADIRRRVHAFRMQADEETERAIEELKAQVEKLEKQVRKLERKSR